MKTIKQILMTRDGNSEKKALKRIKKATNDLNKLLAKCKFDEASYICENHFGLEPEYLDQLI